MARVETAQRQRQRAIHPRIKTAEVDVVVPVYGQGDFLLAMLGSYFEHEPGVKANLILVDDATPQGKRLQPIWDYAEGKGGHIIKHKENQGFAATCNTGAAASKSPFILLLNSDVLITQDGWLKTMVAELDSPTVGVVGPMLTFFPHATEWAPASQIRPAGKVQHAGVVFDILARPYHIFSGWDKDHPRVAQRRELNCVTGACLLTRRVLWNRIEGLDTDYTRGNFEDVQYCLQARHLGYKVIFTPEVELHHYAGGSGNSMTAKRNAELFKIKAGELVQWDEWVFW